MTTIYGQCGSCVTGKNSTVISLKRLLSIFSWHWVKSKCTQNSKKVISSYIDDVQSTVQDTCNRHLIFQKKVISGKPLPQLKLIAYITYITKTGLKDYKLKEFISIKHAWHINNYLLRFKDFLYSPCSVNSSTIVSSLRFRLRHRRHLYFFVA